MNSTFKIIIALLVSITLLCFFSSGVMAAIDIESTISADINGDGSNEKISVEGEKLIVTLNDKPLWYRLAIGKLKNIKDIDGNGILDIVMSADNGTTNIYNGNTGEIMMSIRESAPGQASFHSTINYGTMWWYDYTGENICWRANLASPYDSNGLFLIDFDEDHSSAAVTDVYWHHQYGKVAVLGILKSQYPTTWFAWAFKIGELKIDGPSAHINRADYWPINLETEWFYYYVNDTEPPTDWIVCLKRSDGVNPIPVTDKFDFTEISFEFAYWRSFDPLTTGSIEGHAIDLQNRQPVRDAKIYAERIFEDKWVSITDEFGYFMLWPLTAETIYKVTCKAKGYKTQIKYIKVDVGVGGLFRSGTVKFFMEQNFELYSW